MKKTRSEPGASAPPAGASAAGSPPARRARLAGLLLVAVLAAAVNLGTLANGFDGLGTEFVYNKTKVVSQVARLKKWLDDGVLQIAGQGFSPEQLFTSGRCSTFVNSTASHGNIERNAKIDWGATFLPHENDINPPLNSTIGGGAISGLACNTVYHFRAVATNGTGTTAGADATFTTAAIGSGPGAPIARWKPSGANATAPPNPAPRRTLRPLILCAPGRSG